MAEPTFWDDQESANAVIQETNAIKEVVDGYKEIETEVDDIEVTFELLDEEYDEDLANDVE